MPPLIKKPLSLAELSETLRRARPKSILSADYAESADYFRFATHLKQLDQAGSAALFSQPKGKVKKFFTTEPRRTQSVYYFYPLGRRRLDKRAHLFGKAGPMPRSG
ncbi:MAG: hypothetical protein DNFNHJIP_00039 [Candidatus Argoarchaeum ethanivorans]|uniref:Uncharacterized protein n=1 Tax=Candidatus Argoarchaeum ethanivorans TaxID=2608793 RepID=A0A811ZZS4_9EURY|nr:MAG: hypothetical protein DNFNHJIP_00039 [Candidatus Argoarchaeum ethanivorans]